MAEQGRANREVVQALINDLNAFNEYVTTEIQTMMNKTEALAAAWQDPQYEQFSGFMSELSDSMRQDLVVVQESASFLQRKLALYD